MSNNTPTFKRPFGDPLFGFDFRLFEFDFCDFGNIKETNTRYPPDFVEKWRDFVARIKQARALGEL
jgi:hypothetical protein